MSNPNDVRANQIGAHPLSRNVLSTYNSVSKHPNGPFYVPNTYNVQNKNKVIVRQAPLSSWNASSFLNSSTIDFKLDRAHLSLLTNAYIQVKITNSTGGSCTFAPTPFWVDRIDILGNAGQVLTTVRGQELYLYTSAFLSRNEFEQLAPHFCIGSAYQTTGQALANGDSEVYYIPIFHLFASTKLHLDGLRGDITVRLLTQASSLCILAGSHPTITEVAMLLKGFNEPQEVRMSRKGTYYNRFPLKLPFVNTVRHLDSQTLAAATTYTTVLSTLKGTFIGLFFTIRSATITGANQGNYQKIRVFDLQLASGESLLGHYQRLDEDDQMEAGEIFNNLFRMNKEAYFISFSSDPVRDYMTGSNHGSQVFVGTEKLQFTTNATITPGSYVIDVYALSCEHLHIDQGQVVVKK